MMSQVYRHQAAFPSLRRNVDDDSQQVGVKQARVDGRSLSRIDYLEDRLTQQERNTNSLVDRAFKIREDILESLDFNQGTWQQEKYARQLLQEHIRSITDIVRKLSHDIQILAEQIRVRDGHTATTQDVIKNLEVSHVGSLTDLRGRIVRCDASIARLSSDIGTATETIKVIGRQQQEENSKTVERLHALEMRIRDMSSSFERSLTDQYRQAQHIEEDTSQQISRLDSKTRSTSEGMKASLLSHRQTEQSERDKLEARLLQHIDRLIGQRDDRLDKLQSKLTDCLGVVNGVMKRVDEERIKENEKNSKLLEAMEIRWRSQTEEYIQKSVDDLQRVKQEYREGFNTAHDNIGETKDVLEAKRLLLEEQLRKEISHLRKMVIHM